MGGGGPVGAIGDVVGGIADIGGDIVGGVGDIAGGISDALPIDVVGPALTALNPLAGATYYGIQGDPFGAAMAMAPMPSFGGPNPLAKLGTQSFLRQGGKTAIQKIGEQAIEGLTRSALSKGVGQLAENLGITSKEAGTAAANIGMDSTTGGTDLADQYSAMTGLASGETDIGPGTPKYPGGQGEVGTQSGPPDKSTKEDPEGWWDWVQKTAPDVYEWGKKHGIKVAAVVAAVYAGMGGLEGEQEPLPEQEPSKVSQKYRTELSGAPGRVVQGTQPIFSETETVGGVPKIIGYENIPGPQYIGPEREEFLEAQTAAHGGLMSLQEGGLVDEEEQILRDAMGNARKGTDTLRMIKDIVTKNLQRGVQYDEEGNPFGTSGALSNFLGEPERRLTIDELKNADKNRMLLDNMDRERRERAFRYELEQERLRNKQGGISPEGLGPQGLFRTRPSVEVNPMAGGGFPRQTGAINGPGTGTSDSIPAMLSDGEFVMTSDAVRGAGMGDRMAGAKRMYDMMNKFEGMA